MEHYSIRIFCEELRRRIYIKDGIMAQHHALPIIPKRHSSIADEYRTGIDYLDVLHLLSSREFRKMMSTKEVTRLLRK